MENRFSKFWGVGVAVRILWLGRDAWAEVLCFKHMSGTNWLGTSRIATRLPSVQHIHSENGFASHFLYEALVPNFGLADCLLSSKIDHLDVISGGIG